jgi:HSP20 family protein
MVAQLKSGLTDMPRSTRDILWFDALAELARADRLHRDSFRPTATGWEPPIDVLETATGLVVIIALPGVRPNEMEVVLEHGALSVRGSRHWPALQRPVRVHRIELPHGRFERRIVLPPGTYELTGQSHADGCLLLTLRNLA